MVKILNTKGLNVTKSAAVFESYDLIQYSTAHPLLPVNLTLASSGTVDLSDELGTVSATVHAALSGNSITTGAAMTR